ncbi:P22AR C-terminal domain-containing protein [Pasteurella oralis]|uniref:P22AR C-terminal domain-containing protein n=1 Tax=Pasteurella oralis TaxID=1071947 RepID=A0ABW4NVH1_9PAST
MSTQLSTFLFETHIIRTLSINNEPWFIAKDICKSLNIANVSDALLKLDGDEKMILDNTLGLTESIARQVQEVNLVSESGMYTLILRCRNAVKKGSVPHRFRKWVTAEVLPQIRKTGKYEVQSQQLALPEPEKKYTFSFTEYELQQLAWAWFAFSRCTETLRKLYSPLQKLGSHFAVEAYGCGVDYYHLVQNSNDTINRITKEFKCVSHNNWRVLEHVRNFDKNAIVYNQIHD